MLPTDLGVRPTQYNPLPLQVPALLVQVQLPAVVTMLTEYVDFF